MSKRWALFVDAGWFFAASSDAVFGQVHERRLIAWEPGRLIPDLVERAATLVPEGTELLRTYWYDGSRNRLPEEHHLAVAEAPNVKLRLGRTTTEGQKGVDGLIIHDLITLALGGHIADAVVLSGDEDLLEAIESAQRSGTRVHLLEVRFGGVSRELLRTFDQRATINREFLEPLLGLKEVERPSESTDELPRQVPPLPAQRPAWMDTPTIDKPLPETDTAEAAGAAIEFAERWLANATDEEHLALLGMRPFLGHELDAALLRFASDRDHLNRWLDDDERIALREAFWSTIASGTPGEP